MISRLYLQPVEKGRLSGAGCLRQVEEREEGTKIYTENIGMNVSSRAALLYKHFTENGQRKSLSSITAQKNTTHVIYCFKNIK